MKLFGLHIETAKAFKAREAAATLSAKMLNQNIRDLAAEQAKSRQLCEALALARGDGFAKAVGRGIALDKGRVRRWRDSRDSETSRRVDLTCSVEVVLENSVSEVAESSTADFQGLEWRIVSVAFVGVGPHDTEGRVFTIDLVAVAE